LWDCFVFILYFHFLKILFSFAIKITTDESPTYNVEYLFDKDSYVFESVGHNGSIYKVVIFSEIEKGKYNLGFGDYDPLTNDIDDKIVSDNGDMIKVIATVVGIALKFLSENPMTYIYIKGSTLLRTQFYNRIINRNLDDLIHSYEILGSQNGISEIYQKNTPYESFLIRKLF
jgi:hypothetical protein